MPFVISFYLFAKIGAQLFNCLLLVFLKSFQDFDCKKYISANHEAAYAHYNSNK